MIRRYSPGFGSISLRFPVVTLLLVACQATSPDPIEGDDDNDVTPSGGQNSGAGTTSFAGTTFMTGGSTSFGGGPTGGGFTTGGTGLGAGGTPASGGSGGTLASGGSPSNPVGGAPVAGSVSVAGSAPVAGTGTGSGGSPTTSCDTYSGTLKAQSEIFESGYGQSTKGDWKGYAYPYKFGMATVTPGTSTTMSCFPGKQLCAAGSIPADDGSGAGIGWSINQMKNSSTTGTVVITTPVNVKFKGGAVGMRVGLAPATGDEFCYTLTADDVAKAGSDAGLTLAPSDFKSLCYDTAKATAYDMATEIKAIQVSVPGSASGAKTFDFCLIDIEPG